MVVVLMGASGAGKTTVGKRLSESLGWRFHDADDDHSRASRAKMSAGRPLSDADRGAWLDLLAARIRRWTAEGENVVLACSALSRVHRERLGIEAPGVALVYLKGGEELLRTRLQGRYGHFMPADLLRSQLQTLDEPDPDRAVVLNIQAPPDRLVEQIRSRLGI